MMIKTGHFFAGGGGGILASEILGHESVFALEINERRCRVIGESGWFPGIHIECSDIRQFDATPWKGRMDCIAAGFPCQDISCAGPGTGIKGKRSGLIWELFQAIDIIQPSIIFLENSPAIRTRGRREIIQAIVERGYSWRDGTLAASHVGAGHKRNRWWCLAANANGLRKLEQERSLAEQRGWFGYGHQDSSNAMYWGLRDEWRKENDEKRQEPPSHGVKIPAYIMRFGRSQGSNKSRKDDKYWRSQLAYCSKETVASIIGVRDYTGIYNWIPVDAGVCRMVDGLANKMDRIKTCGDGQVPLQAAVAWGLLAWS